MPCISSDYLYPLCNIGYLTSGMFESLEMSFWLLQSLVFFFPSFFQFHIRHLLKSLGPNKDLSLDISFEVLYLFDNNHLLNFTMYYDYVNAKNIFLKHFSNFCKYVSRKCVYCCFTKNIHQLKNIFTKIIYFILKNK